MKEIYYVYNNEAIATCIFLSIFSSVEKIDVARCCLFLPILLDDRMVGFLNNDSSDNLNFENLISSRSSLFAAFNKKYLSLLPVMINSLLILKKSDQINIEDMIITTQKKLDINIDLGVRFAKIKSAIPYFLELTNNYPTEQLYKLLRVQL